jgi:CDP-diacylglycerol--serine O-phosphatidyltransferase
MNILRHPFFNIPNLLTASNFLCGIASITSCFAGRMDFAIVFIGAALICDFLDGFAARLLSISSDLGKQLDSLADVVSFGVAPGIIMMFMIAVFTQSFQATFLDTDLSANSFIHYQTQSWLNSLFHEIPNDFDASIKYLPLAALMIPVLSLFRLAKFNIDVRQTEKFIGVPTPLNTLFFLFFPLYFLLNYTQWSHTFTSWFGFLFNPYFVAMTCIAFSLLLVAEIPLMALKFKQYKWKGNEHKFILLISSVIVIPIFLVWSIPIILLLFISLSIIENTVVKNKIHEI